VSLYCLHLLQSGFKQTRAVELKTLMFHLIFSSLFLSLSLFLFTRQIPGAVAMTIIKKMELMIPPFINVRSRMWDCCYHMIQLHISIGLLSLPNVWWPIKKPIFRTPEIRLSTKPVHAHNLHSSVWEQYPYLK